LANFFCHTPGFAHLAKWAAGMDQRRRIPAFAPHTLQAWFRRRGAVPNPKGPPVILWPDTFNNHFHTNVGIACVEALEASGFRVMMPRGHVCCGRPLYDYGFLDEAERYLRRTLSVLRGDIRKGTPVIGMEPSCLAVFRDELTKMLPHDDDAARLARNAHHWAEFFLERDVKLPRLHGEALVWGHCHHKATGGIEPELSLLRDRMGLEVEMAKGGCCGLAGSWGFEAGKYDLSMKCGEIGLLPAVRQAEPSTLIVANGFSCRTQLAQSGVGREALHTAEVMKIARQAGNRRLPGPLPERQAALRPSAPSTARAARTAVTLAVSAAAIGTVVRLLGRRNR
jgi:Fe-S oxidoreductase